MTFTSERITQFNPYLEVAALRRGVKPEAVLTQLIHTFAEFACDITLTGYHYLQTPDDQLLAPSREAEGDVLNSFLKGVHSRRTSLEYQSFANLREHILEAQTPTAAITFSPPGPKEEHYSDYGFFYIALIPQYFEGKGRRISMLALKINDFDEQTAVKTLNFIRLLSPDRQLPQGRTNEERLLKSCVVLPIGKGQRIENIQQLFALIGITLNRNFEERAINEGLSGKALAKVYKRFKNKIHQIGTKIWLASQGRPAEIDGKALFRGIDINLMSGGCAAAESLSSADNSSGLHWCPQCGIFFSGSRCPCGYIAND